MQPIVKISKDNLIHNFNYTKSKLKEVSIFGVVKADAYGHGAIQICDILNEVGIDGFCVALIPEVEELRNNGILNKILHIGKFEYSDLDLFTDGETYCTINSLEDIKCIDSYVKDTGKKVFSHIKFDTGMTRMGLPFSSYKNVIDSLSDLKSICIHGLFSHFADADDSSDNFMDEQMKKFNEIKEYAVKRLSNLEYIHIGNSSTLMKGYNHRGNLIRLGISLYGVNPLGSINYSLKPVMRFLAPIVAIKSIVEGDSIGYNRKFIAQKNMKIAIVQAGYADGVPMRFCNTCYVEYEGELLKVLGKVSMDLFCIECPRFDIKIGEFVTIWGGENTRIEEHSKLIDKNLYTFTTKIGNRVKYIYE